MRAFEALKNVGVVAAAEQGTWALLLNRFRPGKFHTFAGTRYIVQTSDIGFLTFRPATGEMQSIRGTVMSTENSHVYTIKVWEKTEVGWESAGASNIPRARGETLDSLYRSVLEEISRHSSKAQDDLDENAPDRERYLKDREPSTIKITGPDVDVSFEVLKSNIPEFRKRLQDLTREFGIHR
jgi:hypothetical protein